MMDARVAKEMDLVFMCQKRKVFEECYQFGMKVNTKLNHPEYCLFADKTG